MSLSVPQLLSVTDVETATKYVLLEVVCVHLGTLQAKKELVFKVIALLILVRLKGKLLAKLASS